MIYLKNCPNQTCEYWLITADQQTLCIETNSFDSGNYKSASGQIQNNAVNGAMSITINRVIKKKTNDSNKQFV